MIALLLETDKTDVLEDQGTRVPMIARLVDAAARHAWRVVLIAAAAAIVASVYTAHYFAIDTETSKLISPELPWRQREITFDAAFPQRADLIAIVVDAATPELAERAAASLAQHLGTDTRHFRTVRRPDAGTYFEKEGLLFLSKAELAETMERMIAAQPLLGMLAADPTLRGVMDALTTMMEGAARDPSAAAQLARPLDLLADAFEASIAGRARPISWRTMINARPPDARELRRFILVRPVLDYQALQPGAEATSAIRTTAAALGLDGDHGVRVRLTGPVPLGDEEFATLEEGAGVNAAVMLGALVTLLWVALRSWRLVLAVAVTLVVGLALTAAFGLAAYGRFNLISVAFAVLFVGLGVDFGVQFCIAYRANRVSVDLPSALRSAAIRVGGALALAAASTAVGFYAFAPTDYLGVSELGVIAGTGMLVAFFANVTLLPALVVLLGAPSEDAPVGLVAFAPLDGFVLQHRRVILGLAAAVALASIAALPRLRFDFNPLHLRSSATESVATLNDLARDPETTPNTIDVLAPSLSAADDLAQRLARLPEVRQAITLTSFVPEQQDEKLPLIEDASLLLDPVLHPAQVKAPPDDAQVVEAMRRAAGAFRRADGAMPAALRDVAPRVVQALRRLADGPRAEREALRDALVPSLTTMLDQLRTSLGAEPVALDRLPADLTRDWVAADGRARIEVFPAGDANDNAILARFVDAVRSVAPDATGAPVSIREWSGTITHAFAEAGAWAVLGIVAILVVTLRDATSVLLTLAPLLLAALTTLGICALTGFALNFENIIALPLLFGIGVAFDIYFVVAWRLGSPHLLASSLSRAVLFSALTTGTAFGSLWLSSHPGTASMGKLLALSLAATLVAVLLFLPALLRSVTPRHR